MSAKKSGTVYYVERGEDHEGGSVLGIFSTLNKAKAWAESYIAADNRRKPWNKETALLWSRGCDWISITETDLDPEPLEPKEILCFLGSV